MPTAAGGFLAFSPGGGLHHELCRLRLRSLQKAHSRAVPVFAAAHA